MAAMTLFGSPPDKYWRNTTARQSSSSAPPFQEFDMELPAFCYAFGQNYRSIYCYRLDQSGIKPADLLQRIKHYFSENMPSMYGFTVYSSYKYSDTNGHFPFPCPNKSAVAFHAVVAVGYDDAKK
jgi:C1A family cysteine protease